MVTNAEADPLTRDFEAAVDALVTGDFATLQRLLRERPQLIEARSRREHAATLLHYVAANGVEDERQKTPANIVEIAELLLRAGAEVDATAAMYGSAWTTLGLAATSVHPERAGVQQALIETLLRHGAQHDSSMVVAAMANGRLLAAEVLAHHCDSLDFVAAASVGRIDVVEARLRAGVGPEQLTQGFLLACAAGRNAVIDFLLPNGANVAMRDNHGQSGLHWAAIGGHLDTVKLLLRHGAPLEIQNEYGGTVLGQTLWSAAHSERPEKYAAIREELVAAGAQPV